MKLRVKSPILTVFWCLPLILVMIHDILNWLLVAHHFYFTDTGFFVTHYTKYEDHYDHKIVHFSESPIWRAFITIVMNAKAAAVALVYALPGLIWINRPRKGEFTPKGRSSRKPHRR